MSNELQYQHEDIKTVKAMITCKSCMVSRIELRAKVSKRLFNAKMRDGRSVYDHCLTMIKDVEELEKLDMIMHKKLQMDLILQFLGSSYG